MKVIIAFSYPQISHDFWPQDEQLLNKDAALPGALERYNCMHEVWFTCHKNTILIGTCHFQHAFRAKKAQRSTLKYA